MWIKNIKNKKAFTLIEFIIVMAIIGILVLLASPKFLDYVKKAKLTQIINDSKVAENYTTTHKAMYDTLPKGNFIKKDKLTELIKNKTLYFEGGVIKDLNDFDKDKLYLLDKDNLVKEINTKLKGNFIYTNKGIIYIDSANYKNKDNINIDDLESMIGPVKQVALGENHSAAITENGDLYTWGSGENGRLGHGNTNNQLTPKKVESLTNVNVKQVSLGDNHSAAITEDGHLYTWGRGDSGRLGLGNSANQLTPKKVEGVDNVKEVTLGEGHSAAITENGDLYTWGWNYWGQLGHGDGYSKNTPTKVEGIDKVKQVALGRGHSAAITENGDLYTWGSGDFGQLGHEKKEDKNVPTKVEGISNVQQVALGSYHSAAITKNGDIYTWGSGDFGRLGHGDKDRQLTPKKVEGLTNVNVKQVSLGSYHSAAVTEDGSLYTWGKGENRRLGHGDNEDKNIPTKVEGLYNVKQVSLGSYHSAAITENGSLYTWGRGDNGRLGHGDTTDRNTPTKVEFFWKTKKVLKP